MLSTALILLAFPLALIVLYLDILTVAALIPRRKPQAVQPRRRFAILIPAHDEEALLPALLASLAEITYPSHLWDVHVVADNCSDDTARVAELAGARVHERHNATLVGKGYALRWLLQRIEGSNYDAYLFLDADSVVSPNLLAAMNSRLADGAEVIQAYYGVLNGEASWSSAVRYAALVLFNHLRPRGRALLGLSAGLRGNGMCFTSSVLQRFGWDSFALAEDAEFHLKLVRDGIRVVYADEASVLAEMPTSLRQAHSQNVRWERGRLQLLRAFGPGLIVRGIRQFDLAQLDAVAEQLVPPLSVLVGTSVVFCCLTVLLPEPSPRLLALAILVGQIGYVGVGLLLARARPHIYLALLGAPFYIVWKLWIYALAAMNLNESRWIRTARGSEES